MSVNRRDVLKQFLGVAGTAILAPSLSLPFARQAKAVEPATIAAAVAVVQAIITIASDMGVFGSKAGGAAQRHLALQIQLRQILDNQELILESIAAVNDSIEALRSDVKALFQQSRFNEIYGEAEKIRVEFSKILRELDDNPRYFLSQVYYDETFVPISIRLGDAITDLKVRVQEESTSENGAALVARATQAAFLLAEQHRICAQLEYKFPRQIKRQIWDPVNRFGGGDGTIN